MTASPIPRLFQMIASAAALLVVAAPVHSEPPAAADPFLKAVGNDIRDGKGKGDVVKLRGVNLGGWLVFESWMCPMDSSGLKDDFSAREILTKRFGAQTRDSLLATYEQTWITEKDLDNIAALGMNVVRVPFWYLNVEEENGAWRDDAYDRLDWVVEQAWKRGIYTIIDLHGAPGGQSDKDHTGRIRSKKENGIEADFWTKEANLKRTVAIWEHIAKHFKGNPAVAAYDLLNEPTGAPDRKALLTVYDRLYKAIRAVDHDHIITMEACWSGQANGVGVGWGWDVLPPPEKLGWKNVVYQMHSYEWQAKDLDKQNANADGLVSQWKAHRKENVPCLLGEFNCMEPELGWKHAIEQYSSNDISWTVWSYKATQGGGSNSWGVYNPRDSRPPVPDLQKDSADVIREKWSKWGEAAFALNPMLKITLAMPLPINDIYSTSAGKTLKVEKPGVLGNDKDLNLTDAGALLKARKVSGPAHGTLSLSEDGSFTYTPAAGFSGTDAFRYRAFDGRLDSAVVGVATIEVTK